MREIEIEDIPRVDYPGWSEVRKNRWYKETWKKARHIDVLQFSRGKTLWAEMVTVLEKRQTVM